MGSSRVSATTGTASLPTQRAYPRIRGFAWGWRNLPVPQKTHCPENKGAGAHWKPTAFPASLFLGKSQRPNGLNQNKAQCIFSQKIMEGDKEAESSAVLSSPYSLSAMHIYAVPISIPKLVRGKKKNVPAIMKSGKSWRSWEPLHMMCKDGIIYMLIRGDKTCM